MAEPTDEERRAIASLKRLAKKWPKSIWLFSASGQLCVMQNKADGSRGIIDDMEDGGVDPARCLATIDIPNDGGDW